MLPYFRHSELVELNSSFDWQWFKAKPFDRLQYDFHANHSFVVPSTVTLSFAITIIESISLSERNPILAPFVRHAIFDKAEGFVGVCTGARHMNESVIIVVHRSSD